MTSKQALFVDYQRRAQEFAVGDMVEILGAKGIGRVIAVYPAIGMVDVEWPSGNTREPVESLQRWYEGDDIDPSTSSNVPGGATVMQKQATSRRVAEAFVKKALYWGAPDRHYKATKQECESGVYNCPKCKAVGLRPASYQRSDGKSEKLLGCGSCLFLIKECDIIGHPSYVDDGAAKKKAKQPFSRIRLTGSVAWRS